MLRKVFRTESESDFGNRVWDLGQEGYVEVEGERELQPGEFRRSLDTGSGQFAMFILEWERESIAAAADHALVTPGRPSLTSRGHPH